MEIIIRKSMLGFCNIMIVGLMDFTRFCIKNSSTEMAILIWRKHVLTSNLGFLPSTLKRITGVKFECLILLIFWKGIRRKMKIAMLNKWGCYFAFNQIILKWYYYTWECISKISAFIIGYWRVNVSYKMHARYRMSNRISIWGNTLRAFTTHARTQSTF